MRPRPRADLISQVTKGNGTFSYEYDSKHNVTKATNDGVSMSISYDAKGNTTGTTLTGTNTSDKITSSAAYDSTGNRVTSQTDARGNTVTYAYGNNISKMTGQPTAVTDPTNVTRTSAYNSQNGRITGTEITGTASLDYIYGSGRLTTMTRDGYKPGTSTAQPQTYTMSYDGFGNMTGVSAGKNYTAYLIRQAIETISRRMSREYSIWILPACTLAEKIRGAGCRHHSDGGLYA